MHWTRCLVVAAAVASLAFPISATAPSPAVAAIAAPSSGHPFSAPTYSPLRTPATISCARSNCTNSKGAYHGYWAIDFVGRQGDPIYATGAGIFHIGAISPGCVTSVDAIERGTWAWIDHGGGVVSKYHHLDAIVAAEGQRVTPSTMIAKMGHAGDLAPCTTNYLHYEVRTGGTVGTRVDPGSLKACTTAGVVTMPQVFGASTWDGLVARQFSTPQATSCTTADEWNRTPAARTVAVRRGNASATLSWGTPAAGTTGFMVTTELYSPSLKAWNRPVYRAVAGTATGYTVTGLVNGRTYRVKVAARNGYGYSAWSSAKTVIPATVPSAPKAPRFLTAPTRDYVHYGWYKSVANGATISRYVTQVRCYRSGKYQAWRTATVGAGTYYYNHRGLTGYSTCQVRVRADSDMGSSAWSTTSTIRKAA